MLGYTQFEMYKSYDPNLTYREQAVPAWYFCHFNAKLNQTEFAGIEIFRY